MIDAPDVFFGWLLMASRRARLVTRLVAPSIERRRCFIERWPFCPDGKPGNPKATGLSNTQNSTHACIAIIPFVCYFVTLCEKRAPVLEHHFCLLGYFWSCAFNTGGWESGNRRDQLILECASIVANGRGPIRRRLYTSLTRPRPASQQR
jgi:hypothetical protein